ncbi:MAG: DUF2812 domain-containing protein [Coprobacillaceae bacterium]
MKDHKKIMCGGLAFADKEDMEMLHRYALDGWVFKEFKGLHYHLYKEAPLDIIFDYDIIDVSKEEEGEYLELLANQGWHVIPTSKGNKGTYFFWANSGTPRIHTDRDIEAQRYNPIYKQSVIGLVLGIVGIIASIFLLSGLPQGIVACISGGMIGGAGMLFLGTYMRINKKRFKAQVKFKPALLIFSISLIVFLVNQFSLLFPTNMFIGLITLVTMIYFGMYVIFQFKQFKDGKEV